MAGRCSAAEKDAARVIKKGPFRGSISACYFAFTAWAALLWRYSGEEWASCCHSVPCHSDDPLMSGLLDGGMTWSGWLDGETGVASGFGLGTVLGVVFGVKFGLVPGVRFGFGDASGAVSGGIVLLGLLPVFKLALTLNLLPFTFGAPDSPSLCAGRKPESCSFRASASFGWDKPSEQVLGVGLLQGSQKVPGAAIICEWRRQTQAWRSN